MRMTLALLLALIVPNTHADARQDLERFFSTVNSLSADFEQVVRDERGKETQRAHGSMAVKRPDLFRWRYAAPNEQLIVGDGTRVSIYDIDLAQVTVRPMQGALSDTPAMLLAGRGRLTENFLVRSAPPSDGIDWVRLVPQTRDTGFDEIRVGFRAGRLAAMELRDGFGQITTLTFKNYRENPPLDAAQFKFKPPAGVDVIGE